MKKETTEKFICLNGTGNTALYYAKGVSKNRVYRSGYPEPGDKKFVLREYPTADKAQVACDFTNAFYNTDFKPVQL